MSILREQSDDSARKHQARAVTLGFKEAASRLYNLGLEMNPWGCGYPGGE